MIQDFCDKMFCINLDNRHDRWNRVQKEFGRIGVSPERFSAIKHEHGRTGCRMSHQAVIKKAKDSNWDRVLIFEDDVLFHPDALMVFDSAIRQLPEEWDLLYFGCIWGTSEPYTLNLSKIVSCKLGHAVIFNKSSYDMALASKEKSMDRTNLLIHPMGRSFCVSPMIAQQEDKRAW